MNSRRVLLFVMVALALVHVCHMQISCEMEWAQCYNNCMDTHEFVPVAPDPKECEEECNAIHSQRCGARNEAKP